MPIKKKKNTNFRKIILWASVIALIILMIVSFPATQHLTEIVVYP